MNIRSGNRPRVCDELRREVAGRLTPRDRSLCQLLWEHKVLTTNQVCQIAFDSVNAAQHRLLILHHLRVLDRFRPLRDLGSAPFHYVLDELGAAVVAAEQGMTVTELGFRHDKVLALAYNEHLPHLVGVNGFFCSLAETARRRRDAALVEWSSERRCRLAWGALVRPDGFGRWREGSAEVEFFLEYDAGTEPLARLVAKLDGYAELAAATQISTPTLFWLPGPRREAGLRKALDRPPVPVATATAASGRGPAEAVWLPVGQTSPRCRLAELDSWGAPSAIRSARAAGSLATRSRKKSSQVEE